MASPSEVDPLRFAVTADVVHRLRHAHCMRSAAISRAKRQRIQVEFWDTPNLDIRRAGCVLQRVRIDRGGWIERWWTGTDAGHWCILRESPCVDGHPAAALPSTVEADARALRPVFAARITRTMRTATFADDTSVAIAIDRGESRIGAAHGTPIPVRELVIALVHGSAERLFELAFGIVEEFPSPRLLFGTQADDAYRQLLGASASAPGVPMRGADRTWSPARLAYVSTRNSLAQIACNVDGARSGADVEALHQLRVGIRRFRTVSAIGRDAGLPSLPDSARAELKRLWAALGEARDWDVFAGETWPAAGQLAESRSAMKDFDDAAATLRSASYARLRSTLYGKRFQRVMLSLQQLNMLQRQQAARAVTARRSRKVARELLARRAAKLARRDSGIARRSSEELHALRIAVKRLRYLGEFFACLYDPDATKPYLKRLAAMQTLLGRLNDLAVSERLVRAVGSALPERQRTASREVWGRYAGLEAPRLRRRLAKEAKRLRKEQPFWE